MRFWKKKNVEDERFEAEQNKIYKEVYFITSMLIFLSLIWKTFTTGLDLSNIYVELILLFVPGIYYSIRYIYLGLFSDVVEMHNRNSKYSYLSKNLFYGILSGIILALIFGVNSAVNYADSTGEAYYFFFLVFFVSLLMYVPFFAVFSLVTYQSAKKKSDQIANKRMEDMGD
ncbi:DUF6773 family protein [Saliterribacillus persicus]|uniref:Uncharacterized protein n=1 Tax=Saliterribacillus persicus TaxID=930114 RepID=A0A368Y6F9_9BACI|nr:DUF6773 family protein [Saliterribacillus persicus]RCW74938.1 hypothetical protein DFR57_103235 [Saliterribacillus persicus]